MPPYQRASRSRIDLIGVIFMDEVALAATRLDEILPELAADVADVDLEQVRHRIVVLVEQVLVEPGARHDLAAAKREELDESVFASRDRHRLAVLHDGLGPRVDDDVA